MALRFDLASSTRQPVGEPTLLDYVRILWRHKAIIALTVIVATVAVVGIDRERTRVYQGTAQLLFTTQGASSSAGPASADVTTDIELVPSAQVQALVAKTLHTAVAPPVSVTEVGSTAVAAITVHSTNPSFAAAAANSYARAYIQISTKEFVSAQLATEAQIQNQITNLQSQISTVTNELNATSVSNGAVTSTTIQTRSSSTASASRLNAQLTGLYSQLSSLQTQLNQVQLTTAQGSSAGQLVTPAVTDPTPVSPKKAEDALIAAALGLLLGLGFALLRDHLDDRIRGVADLEVAGAGLPALGLVPVLADWRNRKAAFLVTAERPRSPAAEAYRALRTSVQFMAVDRPVKILQITSPGAVEGKTTTAVNLAYAMGEAGQRTVLIDCDLRRPRVHEFFGLSNDIGLTSVLLGEAPLEKVLLRVAKNPGIRVIPAGPIPPNPSELLSGESSARLFRSLASSADIVVLDSAPVLPVTDAVVLAARVDGVILVAAAGISTARAVSRTLELLGRVDARIVGTVLNRAPEIGSYAPYAYGGYGYGYGYEPRSGPGAANEIEPAHLRRGGD